MVNKMMIELANIPKRTFFVEFVSLGLGNTLDGEEVALGRMGKGFDGVDTALHELLNIRSRDTKLLYTPMR